jgi:peptide/histidine transporter 3/4
MSAVVEVALRFAYYGLAGNLITYLTNDLHQSTSTAIKNVNTWVGVSAIFPIFGAIVADSLLGRFKTILLASAIYFLVCSLATIFNSPSFVTCYGNSEDILVPNSSCLI